MKYFYHEFMYKLAVNVYRKMFLVGNYAHVANKRVHKSVLQSSLLSLILMSSRLDSENMDISKNNII